VIDKHLMELVDEALKFARSPELTEAYGEVLAVIDQKPFTRPQKLTLAWAVLAQYMADIDGDNAAKDYAIDLICKQTKTAYRKLEKLGQTEH
jgi:hypothetical protein